MGSCSLLLLLLPLCMAVRCAAVRACCVQVWQVYQWVTGNIHQASYLLSALSPVLLPSPCRRYERGKLIIFVSSQDRCDTLFRDLLRAGYPALRWGQGLGLPGQAGQSRGGCIGLRRARHSIVAVQHPHLPHLACCTAAESPCSSQHPHPALLSPPATRSLHGGKDQSDRESTIADFKANVCNILTATSGA